LAQLQEIGRRFKETVEAREAAEAASRAKSRFLANMSHELRTPLNAIIGFADMMTHEIFGPLGNPRYREYISSIHKSGQHLLDLINDILDVAKIEAGKSDLNIKEMNLVEAVDECIRTVAERAAQGGVSLNVAIPAHDLTCSADQRAIKQIVLNLLSNAIKFTPAGGQVDVALQADDGLVHIEIRDNGIGVAAEDLPRLTKPFEQVCDDPMLTKAGTGLGLALVRALVEQHGGRFKIDSPDQHGTIATVELPRFAVQRAIAA
jgi:two-component system cell cycle sensor histidine kinase PleC